MTPPKRIMRARRMFRIALHDPTVKRLIALLGQDAAKMPTITEAVDAAVNEIVRIMDDPDVTVQRMSVLIGEVQRQRIEDAQTIAASVGAKMWIHNEATGIRLEFRKDDAVVSSSFLPDRTFERADDPTLLAKRTESVTKH